MFKYITTTKKKWLLLLTTTAVLALALIQAQINLTQVSAVVIPISVNVNGLDFGQVFPGENLDKSFTVTYTDTDETGQPVVYTIIQKIKPLPNVVVPDDYSGTVSQYCQENPADYSRCYHNLCPYITKISQDDEADEESGAEVGPVDTNDNWLVNLSVPAIIGQVAQDHNGGLISVNGDYGCDISLNIID